MGPPPLLHTPNYLLRIRELEGRNREFKLVSTLGPTIIDQLVSQLVTIGVRIGVHVKSGASTSTIYMRFSTATAIHASMSILIVKVVYTTYLFGFSHINSTQKGSQQYQK